MRFNLVFRKSLSAQYAPNIPLPITTTSKSGLVVASSQVLQTFRATASTLKEVSDNRPHQPAKQ